jgi:hypothetical protein
MRSSIAALAKFCKEQERIFHMFERNTIRDLSEIECIQVSGGFLNGSLPPGTPIGGPVQFPGQPPKSIFKPDPKPEPLS